MSESISSQSSRLSQEACRARVASIKPGFNNPFFGGPKKQVHLHLKGRKFKSVKTFRRFPMALVFHGFVGKGVSESAFIEFDDGYTYLVKFHSSLEKYSMPRNTLNELLGERLGRQLCLPIPSTKIVWVSKDFIDATDELKVAKGKNPPREAGLHIGVLKIDRAYNLAHPRIKSKMKGAMLYGAVTNQRDLAGTIVFDTWVLNGDRIENEGNSLFQEVSRSKAKYNYWQIDHGHIFTGPNWRDSELNIKAPIQLVLPGFKGIHNHAVRFGCFTPFLGRLNQNIDPGVIEDYLDQVPTSWGLGYNERQALLSFLQTRQHLTPALLSNEYPGV